MGPQLEQGQAPAEVTVARAVTRGSRQVAVRHPGGVRGERGDPGPGSGGDEASPPPAQQLRALTNRRRKGRADGDIY